MSSLSLSLSRSPASDAWKKKGKLSRRNWYFKGVMSSQKKNYSRQNSYVQVVSCVFFLPPRVFSTKKKKVLPPKLIRRGCELCFFFSHQEFFPAKLFYTGTNNMILLWFAATTLDFHERSHERSTTFDFWGSIRGAITGAMRGAMRGPMRGVI